MDRQATLQMSAAAVTLVISMTSGAIQYGVPTTERRRLLFASSNSPSLAATPKSASLTRPCNAAYAVIAQACMMLVTWLAGCKSKIESLPGYLFGC